MYYGCILLLFSFPTWVFKWPILLPKNSWNSIGYNSNIILWYFDEFFKGVLFLQWVQRCLAQKTKLIFNRFLPQRLRWFLMDFYAESKLIFNRFLHQKTRDCQCIFSPEYGMIFSRFLANELRWFYCVPSPENKLIFKGFLAQKTS